MTTYDGPIVDPDVHHAWKHPSDLLPYLPAEWRERLTGQNGVLGQVGPPSRTYPNAYGGNERLDAIPEAGPAGSDYPMMKRQLLDGTGITHAVLSFAVGANPGHTNPDLADRLTRAINDWNVDTWLSGRDDRLYSGILVQTQDPPAAVAEIRRLASHPRLIEVLLVANGLSRPFGHVAYHPIYAAAAECGLPVAVHIGGENIMGVARQQAGGTASSRLEWYAVAAHAAQHHVMSFVTNGVFEKFPTLKLVVIESGYSWLPWVIWGLDGHYQDLRRESPWVRRLPSEYLRQHVRFTTQPSESSPAPAAMIALLESCPCLQDMLCFATDYPHWDSDDPLYVARRIPERWHRKLFYENAADLYGLPRAPTS
jgi:predicted TIM-barrel fold metal-dependent hydrolase